MFSMVDNTGIPSYAGDNTPYGVGKSRCDLETKLERLDISTKFSLPACILENENSQKLLGVTVDWKLIINENSQKLLGVTIDWKLNINENVTNLCDKASKKLKHSQELSHIYPRHKNDF